MCNVLQGGRGVFGVEEQKSLKIDHDKAGMACV
jgi:hypothetical protein